MKPPKCYLSRNGYIYMPKRLAGGGVPKFKLCVKLRQSQQWTPLPGMPVFVTLESANEKLDHLAELNGWEPCDQQGVKLKRE